MSTLKNLFLLDIAREITPRSSLWTLPCPMTGISPFTYLDAIARVNGLQVADLAKVMGDKPE